MKLYLVVERVYENGPNNEWFRTDSFTIGRTELLSNEETANEVARSLNNHYSFKGILYNGNEDSDQEEELIEPYEVIELNYE